MHVQATLCHSVLHSTRYTSLLGTNSSSVKEVGAKFEPSHEKLPRWEAAQKEGDCTVNKGKNKRMNEWMNKTFVSAHNCSSHQPIAGDIFHLFLYSISNN